MNNSAFCFLQFCVIGIFQNFGIYCIILDTGDSGCPTGSYENGSYCYKVSASSVTFSEARQICQKDGGFLAIFNDPQTKEFVQRLGIRTFFHRYWIGLREMKEEMRWRWTDKRPLRYQDWAPEEPNNYDDQLHCANLWLERDLQWDDENCKTTLLFVCEYGLESQKCSSLPHLNQSCFEVSQEFLNFEDASSKCKLQGGHLAHVKNQETSDLLKSMIFTNRQWTDWSAQEVSAIINDHTSWTRYVWIGGVNQTYPDITTAKNTGNGQATEPYTKEEGSSTRCPAAYQRALLPTKCDKNISLICQYPVNLTAKALQMTSSTVTVATSTAVLKVEPNGETMTESSTIEIYGSGMDPLNTSFVKESQEITDENMDSGSATVTSIVLETGGKPIVIVLAAIGTFIIIAVVVAIIMFLKYKRYKKSPVQEQYFEAQSDSSDVKSLPETGDSTLESIVSTQYGTESDGEYIAYHAQLFEEERCDERCGNGFVMHRTLL